MKRKAIRSLRSGMIFPMNENMLQSDDAELVYVDDQGKVIEPEEIGPVDAMDLPDLGEDETAKVSDKAQTSTRRTSQRRKSS